MKYFILTPSGQLSYSFDSVLAENEGNLKAKILNIAGINNELANTILEWIKRDDRRSGDILNYKDRMLIVCMNLNPWTIVEDTKTIYSIK